MSQHSLCALDVRNAPAGAALRGYPDTGNWPPRSLASDLMGARSGLDCYQPGVTRCQACRFALELPLALMRAADEAVQDGQCDEALGLIRNAYQAAAMLVPQAI